MFLKGILFLIIFLLDNAVYVHISKYAKPCTSIQISWDFGHFLFVLFFFVFVLLNFLTFWTFNVLFVTCFLRNTYFVSTAKHIYLWCLTRLYYITVLLLHRYAYKQTYAISGLSMKGDVLMAINVFGPEHAHVNVHHMMWLCMLNKSYMLSLWPRVF